MILGWFLQLLGCIHMVGYCKSQINVMYCNLNAISSANFFFHKASPEEEVLYPTWSDKHLRKAWRTWRCHAGDSFIGAFPMMARTDPETALSHRGLYVFYWLMQHAGSQRHRHWPVCTYGLLLHQYPQCLATLWVEKWLAKCCSFFVQFRSHGHDAYTR